MRLLLFRAITACTCVSISISISICLHLHLYFFFFCVEIYFDALERAWANVWKQRPNPKPTTPTSVAYGRILIFLRSRCSTKSQTTLCSLSFAVRTSKWVCPNQIPPDLHRKRITILSCFIVWFWRRDRMIWDESSKSNHRSNMCFLSP